MSQFQPRPFKNDGGFTLGGLGLTALVGILSGLIIGTIAGVIGQFFYAILIFPLLIGLIIGGLQVTLIDKTKVRNPMVCGAVGLLAGIATVIAMHHVDYRAFQMGMAQNKEECMAIQSVLATTQDPGEREFFAQMLKEYQNDPEVISAEQVDSFITYIDWSAKQGVQLSSAPNYSDSRSQNIGYVGSYLYWSIDALIIAAMCAFLAHRRSTEPFCSECENWIKERELGVLRSRSQAVVDVLAAGRLVELYELLQHPSEQTGISVYQCQCGSDEAIVRANNITYNDGSKVKKNVGTFAYPSSVVAELTAFFSHDDMHDEIHDDLADMDPEMVRKLREAANTPVLAEPQEEPVATS